MELNRRKYNIIVIILIILISAVIIFSAVDLSSETNPISPSETTAEENNQGEEESNSNNDVAIVEDKSYLPKAPSFSNGWVALNYAYKILDNYSYTTTMSQTGVNDEIKIAGISFIVRQQLNEKKYKSADGCLIETTASCSNSEGANYYKYTFIDVNNNVVTTRCGETKNFTNEATSKATVADFTAKTAIETTGLYYKLTSSNASLDSFKIVGSNYELKLTLKANSSAFNNLEKFVMSSPVELRNFKGESVSFEIKIDRKTGSFKSITTTERYSIQKNTNIAGWQGSTITTTSTESFTYANIDLAQIAKNIVK